MFPLSLLFNSSARKSMSGFNNALKNVGQTDISSFVNFGNFRANQGGSIMIPSLSSFIRFLQRTVGGNILSTPQVIALDHLIQMHDIKARARVFYHHLQLVSSSTQGNGGLVCVGVPSDIDQQLANGPVH